MHETCPKSSKGSDLNLLRVWTGAYLDIHPDSFMHATMMVRCE